MLIKIWKQLEKNVYLTNLPEHGTILKMLKYDATLKPQPVKTLSMVWFACKNPVLQKYVDTLK